MQFYNISFTVTVLCYDTLARIHIGCRCGRILSALFVIVALTIKEQYDIGILLDRTRISQVGNLRSVVITLSAARESCDRVITGTFISFARIFRFRVISEISFTRLSIFLLLDIS